MTTNNLTGAGVAHEVDPVSRIEGHLGVKVTKSAAASSPTPTLTVTCGAASRTSFSGDSQRCDHVHAAHLRCVPRAARPDRYACGRRGDGLEQEPHHLREGRGRYGRGQPGWLRHPCRGTAHPQLGAWC